MDAYQQQHYFARIILKDLNGTDVEDLMAFVHRGIKEGADSIWKSMKFYGYPDAPVSPASFV